MLSTFGPLSLDLYLPALPELAADLGASTSAAQLTLTSCLVGLAAGQAVAGPLSDRFGRRRPLLIGLAAYALVSIACAFAGSVAVLIVLRLVQGLAGAAGLVIARAVARDLYEGRALVVFFSRLVLVAGLAPVIAPVLGGQLSRVMSWRGIFGVLAAFGVVLLLAGWFGVRETLPLERRVTGGMVEVLRGFGILLRDRLFVGAALSAGLAGASHVRLHRRVDVRAAADLRPQPAGVLAGLRGQLARPDGVCPAEWPAGPPVVGTPAPRRRAGGEPSRFARAWRSACCSA